MEITWSLMHPTPLDPDYFERVLGEAEKHSVDGFELCGNCHDTYGGLDGCLDYAPYPSAAAKRDAEAVDANIARLNRITALAHETERPVLYWHREVILPANLPEDAPELLDANGEFDFFGDAFHRLIDYKLKRFFEMCPGVDGLVLTLTEADYGVIHPSDPERYPPREVVKTLVGAYLDRLEAMGKRFVLRSFGSVPEDYETILAAAEALSRQYDFEVETKVTPYDFVPFLEHNPFLRKTGNCRLGVELDVVGEFLGAGYLPAFNGPKLADYVGRAREAGADRLSLRLDRVGSSVFARGYRANLDIVHGAASDPEAKAKALAAAACRRHAPDAPEELSEILDLGRRAILQTLYVDGNVLFHKTPVEPALQWIQAGGFFGVLHGDFALAELDGIWSLLADRRAPPRAEIPREKENALALALEGQRRLGEAEDRLPAALRDSLREEFDNLAVAAEAIRDFTEFTLRYFENMESGTDTPDELRQRAAAHIRRFGEPETDTAFRGVHFRHRRLPEGGIQAWARPLGGVMREMLALYPFERALREEAAKGGPADRIVAGGLVDDWRLNRYMHASHVLQLDGQWVREIGNTVFPNGFVDCTLNDAGGRPLRLRFDAPRPPALRCSRRGPDGRWEELPADGAGRFFPDAGTLETNVTTTPAGRPGLRWIRLLPA